MERYLKIENLEMALGDQANLPSAEELQRFIAETEISLFTGSSEIPDSMIKAGWYLHSVASARRSLELYSYDRQRRAYQISAHIFDMAIQGRADVEREDILSYVFAAQIGYLRGGLNPNATALYRSIPHAADVVDAAKGNAALEVGVMLLAMDRKALFDILPALQEQLGSFEDIQEGSLGALNVLLDACWNLLLYLSYGEQESYRGAVSALESIVRSDEQIADIDTRWVAAHLLDIAEDFGQSSIWSILPPNVPSGAAKAMTLGTPPVLNLWPPQLQLLREDDANNPLLLTTKRLFLSIPTSAGKTLLAQFISLTHLAQGGGGICFVAPSHSLCREIRKSLSDRLRLLRQEVEDDIPLGLWDIFGEPETEEETPRVEVMTPESLGFLLRHKPKDTLRQFKLFIIDEAHLLAEESRGWGLEATLSLLHMLTNDKEHRIVLMSSSFGSQSHITQWIGVDGANRKFHSEWRGPRRLYALYTPERSARSEQLEVRVRGGRGKTEKHFKYQLNGMIRLKVADTSEVYEARIEESVGVQYTRPGSDGRYKKDGKKSTPFYKTIVPLVIDLGKAGPVLVIVPTRPESQNLARALADTIESEDENKIAALATTRLGSEHLLTKLLKRGVAFHHAALPSDLQAAIETGVKNGEVKYLVSTTTLADGVNLPVRTVVIGNTGAYTSGGFREFITGSKLVNAIGRAGRSGKESEGWIVLADARYEEGHFEQLIQTNPAAIDLMSQLTSEVSLLALAETEASLAASQDNIFELPHTQVSDFLSYIWTVSNSLEEVNNSIGIEDIERFLSSTLAWQQMDEELRARWLEVAKKSFKTYENTAAEKRRRWALSGTSLPSSRKLEDVLLGVLKDFLISVLDRQDTLDTDETLRVLLSKQNISLLFSLPEAPKTAFYPARNAHRDSPLEVDHQALLFDWINGIDLSELVSRHLSQINDKEYAYESMGDYITSVCEHYLPWLIGTLVVWSNEFPQQFTGTKKLVNPHIPAYIRYGVDNAFSLELMMNGVTSRQLAMRVGQAFMQVDELRLRNWIKGMKLADFKEQFNADDGELRDLLNYLRPKDSTVLADFINGESINLEYGIRCEVELSGEVRFAYLDGGNGFPSRLGVEQEDMTCDMPLSLYMDIEELLETGLPYSAKLYQKPRGVYGVQLKMITFMGDTDDNTNSDLEG